MWDEFESLVEQLQDPSPRKRLYALHELLKEEQLPAIPAQMLLTLFRTDPDVEVRYTALEGLALLGERVPLPPILDMLSDPAFEEWRARIVDLFGHLGKKAPVEMLIRLVQTPGEEAGVRESALESLVLLKDQVPFSLFLQSLNSEEPALRSAVVRAVAAGDLQVPPELLITCLSDSEGDVRKEALRALANAPVEAAIEPVVARLCDPEPQVREKAALAVDTLVEWFGARFPLDDLIRLIQDPIFYVRETAIDALSHHPQFIPVAPLVQALKDEHQYVRLAAADALVKMVRRVSSDFKSTLQEALSDPDKRVRQKVAFVLLVMAGLADPDDPPQQEMKVTKIG